MKEKKKINIEEADVMENTAEEAIEDMEEVAPETAEEKEQREKLMAYPKERLVELIAALVEENESAIKEADSAKEEIERVKADAMAEVDAAKAKTDEYLGKLAGLKGDFDRFKNRNAQARETALEEGKAFVIQKLMPVLDTFDRAKQAVSDENTIAALDLILKQFEKILGDLGIEEMEVLGLEFDPNTANAIVKQPVEDETMKGKVVTVVTKGFKQGDKVLRYPQVIVGV